MSIISEDSPKLDDVLLFNDYLLKLAQAGVPIGLDTSGDTEGLLEKLSKINSHFAIGIAGGSSVRQMLETSQELPSTYRTSLSTWLFCDQSPDAIKSLSDCASGRRDMQKLVGYSTLQPLILAVLVYMGFLFLLVTLWPKMHALSQQIRATPGWGLSFLAFAMQTIRLWAVAVPLLILITFLIWRRQRAHWSFSWLPGRRGIAESIQKANYLDGLANLMEHNYSDSQASNAIGSRDIEAAKDSPLMQWALGDGVESTERANALHASAGVYRRLAQSRSDRLRTLFPIFLGAFVGGGLVLFYGLSLFVPMIEILLSLTSR